MKKKKLLKNPGKKKRSEEKENRNIDRGTKIPVNRIVEDKKSKSKSRSNLKKALQKEIKEV